MKKTIIIALLIACTSGLSAQDQQKEQRTPEQRAQAHTERMTKALGLTAEQTASVDAINLKYAQQAEAMRIEQQKKRKTMRDAHEAEMKAVLTPEQFAAWQQKREEAKAKHMERRKAMRDDRIESAPTDPKQ